MNIEMITRIPRDVLATDTASGAPTEMFYHSPLVKITTGLRRSNATAVFLDGQWYVRASKQVAARCEANWEAAENPVDRSLEVGLRRLAR